jgi:hypothetical protein
MLKTIIRTAAAGAFILLSANLAHAQTAMRLDVPFSFRTPTAQMPAGEYVVTQLSGTQSVPFYRFTHLSTGKNNVVVTPTMVTRKGDKEEGLPGQVRFLCISEYCALSEIYSASRYGGHGLSLKARPAHPDVAKGHTVVIAAR